MAWILRMPRDLVLATKIGIDSFKKTQNTEQNLVNYFFN